jgi:hypothetical protein
MPTFLHLSNEAQIPLLRQVRCSNAYISGNKKVINYAELVQELTEQGWQEIYWLEEHVANVSYES